MADAQVGLGRVGIWTAALDRQPASVARRAAQEIDRLGYGALWVGEATRREAFANAAMLLGWTSRLSVATGIANIWARDAQAMAAGQLTLAEAFPGRFLLGIGVSHRPLVDGRGHDYGRPLATMAAYLDAMDRAAYDAPRPAQRPPRLIAALGPAMLGLARDRADGAHPYFVPVEHTVGARRILGPDRLLCPEQAVVLEASPTAAREVARGGTPPATSDSRTTPATCPASASTTRTWPQRAATAWSTPWWPGETSTPWRAGSGAISTRAPTTWQSRCSTPTPQRCRARRGRRWRGSCWPASSHTAACRSGSGGRVGRVRARTTFEEGERIVMAGPLVVFGDFNCPYSALASARVDRIVDAGIADVEWRAVEHDPDIPPGGRPVTGELAQAYQREVEEVTGLLLPHEHLDLRVPAVQPNTAAAVTAFAAAAGGRADELRRELFQALWADGRNIGDPAELARLAGDSAPGSALRVERWRQQWVATDRHVVPMMIVPHGRVSRGLGALARLASIADRAGDPETARR